MTVRIRPLAITFCVVAGAALPWPAIWFYDRGDFIASIIFFLMAWYGPVLPAVALADRFPGRRTWLVHFGTTFAGMIASAVTVGEVIGPSRLGLAFAAVEICFLSVQLAAWRLFSWKEPFFRAMPPA